MLNKNSNHVTEKVEGKEDRELEFPAQLSKDLVDVDHIGGKYMTTQTKCSIIFE